MKKTNIKNRRVFTAVSVITLITAFLAGSLIWFGYRNSNRITDQNKQYLLDNAVQVADNVDDTLTQGYNNIKVLSRLVSESLTSDTYDITHEQEMIRNSVFDFMEYADKDGLDHNITGGTSDAKDRQYYLNALAGNSGMELIYESRATHETLLMFYAPIYYNETTFAGSLVGVYQASNRITKTISSEYFGHKSTSYYATEEGRIIACSDGTYDPTKEFYVSDIAGTDVSLKDRLEGALTSKKQTAFEVKDNRTGGVIKHLENNGGYFIEIFPKEANDEMIKSANLIGYELVVLIILIYAITILLLISFYRMQQKAVEQARTQAEKANQAKTDFLFNMSHDIRTPMNAILGYSDIALRYKNEPARVDDSLKKIQKSGNHLLALINDILEMSRIESGKLELTEERVDINEAINETKMMGESLALAKDIDFVVGIGGIENQYVYADKLHVNEVLINLISNAVKYTQNGGRVWYRIKQDSDVVDGRAKYRFEIGDNGIGMSEEFLKHVFEPFNRENKELVNKTEGAGLGLSIVKKIVDLAGGTIEVFSQEGQGTSVVLTFMFKVMNEEEIADFVKKEQLVSAENDDSLLKGKKVLLTEDNAFNREIATEILEQIGIIVEAAEDGQIAVNKVKENGVSYYDFILMDIQMPVMNGYEATEAIRALPDGNKVPIIALSANAFKEDKDKSISVGMNDHIAKPINIEVLIETLTRLL